MPCSFHDICLSLSHDKSFKEKAFKLRHQVLLEYEKLSGKNPKQTPKHNKTHHQEEKLEINEIYNYLFYTLDWDCCFLSGLYFSLRRKAIES